MTQLRYVAEYSLRITMSYLRIRSNEKYFFVRINFYIETSPTFCLYGSLIIKKVLGICYYWRMYLLLLTTNIFVTKNPLSWLYFYFFYCLLDFTRNYSRQKWLCRSFFLVYSFDNSIFASAQHKINDFGNAIHWWDNITFLDHFNFTSINWL